MVHQTPFINLHMCLNNLSLYVYHSTSVLTLRGMEAVLILQHTNINTAPVVSCSILIVTFPLLFSTQEPTIN